VKSALITGVTGQDGSYLAELLLDKGYQVYGLVRRASTPNTGRIDHLLGRITLIPGDMLDGDSLVDAVIASQPDEVYHLAAQSDVGLSFRQPILTAEVNAVGTVRLLEAIRREAPKTRVYHASTSEMFGNAAESPQSESTPFHPRSPYGSSKVYAHHMMVHYREAYGLFTSCGICFNHESARRGHNFVTRKVAREVARIAAGQSDGFSLGNLLSRRDWGWAPDYVRGMWQMLRQDEPTDFVLATGVSHSVQDLVEAAFAVVDLPWADYVHTDASLHRPTEVDHLRGDASLARAALGWQPTVSFAQLVEQMVRAEMALLSP
jgi:GDPmannose 4,6-dehydratase